MEWQTCGTQNATTNSGRNRSTFLSPISKAPYGTPQNSHLLTTSRLASLFLTNRLTNPVDRPPARATMSTWHFVKGFVKREALPMPVTTHMTWVASGRRWVKKFKDRWYAVSCRKLGAGETKEASARAAN